MGKDLIVRFAPSPNGYLHLGHAYSALLNARFAKRHGAQLLLRIEDIDIGRRREEYVTQIKDDLDWLGLEWAVPERVQSQHFAFYMTGVERLKSMGLLYPCFCSRKELAAAWGTARAPLDPDGGPLYKGTCKKLNEGALTASLVRGEPHCWRLDMAKATRQVGDLFFDELRDWRTLEVERVKADPRAFGDVVIVRKDVPTSYHLSVVMDDAHQHISHIVRGKDLYHATSIHRLLQALLELEAPTYFHHHLLLDAAGDKLSKSKMSQSIRDYRAQGGTLTAFETQWRAQGLL